MKKRQEHFDVVVCGGGLAGFCAAVASARQGAVTCLIQDRPVFGGNSSSEIRVTPHGAAAFHAYARETGIISELLIEERARNHEQIRENGWTNSVWDLTMYDMAVNTDNLVFHLNTSIVSVCLSDKRTIRSVICRVAGAETEIEVNGTLFIDCTGDGIVADRAGCQWRWGTESREEFNEPHAPLKASKDTMGNSIHFKAKDMGRPVPFHAPDWAIKHENPDYFYKQGRQFYDIVSGYWWIEIGVPWNTIYDAEHIRHELTRHTLGIWDWMKNKDPELKERTANYALDWIGQVPGKRESRRIIGHYLMTEHDPVNNTVFDDEIAFGGWFIDLHTPGGLLAPTAEPSSAEDYSQTTDYAVKSYCGPYGIPLRIMIARDVDNLMMAGRNVSVTHAALGTVRVMATTALMGQAAGVAAAVALERKLRIGDVSRKAIREVRQRLLRDGCFLPNCRNEDANDAARTARITASSSAKIYGVGPECRDYTGGYLGRTPLEQIRSRQEPLLQRRGQWIAVGADRIDRISVFLSNDTTETQMVPAKLLPVRHIWDYRCEPSDPIAETVLQVPPGEGQWVDWNIGATAVEGLPQRGYVRLDLLANPNVQWHSAGTAETGHCSAYEMGGGRMRRYLRDGGTLCFRVEPAQASYEPENVISGVTRPHAYTNLWKSDPNQPLPQWLQLEWPSPQPVRQIELTFSGHLYREYHLYEPLYRDPQCAKDYSISGWVGGVWVELVSVKDNYQRHRKHSLPDTFYCAKLRIDVHATNGDPSAAIYEVRCYGDE